ncbi:small multi-drug export protein [Candidatus Oleimmundimicrobium sp.]|uniref:COG2426 family protein n=1 Tax=Candidatus Oleimmundimicrobium sp. TaxID=3060597 RepID=UPI00271904C2|nr:small multi-drug export protein [Candidatus Oleimmundimicrobium sp.]MDO8886933.1 small multi-drug export protein [Candidatus Oleimmundimicrobium sp.]
MVKYILTTLIPWIELRGAIPYAVKNNDLVAIPFIILTNILIFFPVYFGLEMFYVRLSKRAWLKKRLGKIRKKARPYVERYGLPGLMLFVMIPLPGTGAYSGSAAAWLLGLKWKPSFGAIFGGVVFAGFLVFLLSVGFFNGFSL